MPQTVVPHHFSNDISWFPTIYLTVLNLLITLIRAAHCSVNKGALIKSMISPAKISSSNSSDSNNFISLSLA